MSLKKISFLFCLLYTCFSFSQTTTDTTSNSNDGSEPTALEKKIFGMNDRIANDPKLQAGSINPDSVPSLPIGIVKKIGETVFIVAIDSAFFKQDKAYFNAYMALDFPGANRKLAFAGKNINFNPKGVLVNEGVKLQLVSDALLHLGPKLDLFIKGDGSTYVEFDCNGYKRTRVKGEFRFLGDGLEPTTPNAKYVTATVDIIVEDLQNLYASVTFSPFMVKGLKDYKFAVSEATVDLSDFQNPSATLPTAYVQTLGDNQELWRGFYLKNLTVTLPRKISDKSGSNTQVGVNDLFIDDSGVTGLVFANNVLSTTQGSMSGWGFSVKRIEIGLQSNTLVRGYLKGEIAIKPLDDDTLSYSALFARSTTDSTDIDYTFTIGLTDTMELGLTALSSKLYVFPNSTLVVTDQNADDEFVPTLTLNGKYSVVSGKAKIDKVGFQNFVVTTTRPYLLSATFSLIPDSGHVANFPISITSIGFRYTTDNSKLIFSVGLGLNLGDADSKVEFSANTTIDIYAFTHFNQPNTPNLVFEKVAIGDITFAVNTTPFNLYGVIVFKDDDPVFGKLFYGAIQFKLNNIMQEYAILRAGFGKIDRPLTATTSLKYKYWFVDGQVPVNITMGQVAITKIIGGASYHVKPDLSNADLVSKIKDTLHPNANIPFTPDNAFGLAFKAGVGFKNSVKEETLNGDAVLGVLFNANGGFASIDLIGNVFMMVKIEDRYDDDVENRIYGNINANYTHVTKTFHTTIDATAQFGKALEGNLNVTVHIDPASWYVWFNRPSQRATVTLKRDNGTVLVSASAYLMFGTLIDDIPAMPSYVASLGLTGGNSVVNSNRSALNSGGGLVVGMGINSNMSKNYNIEGNWYVYFDAAVALGFDLMIMKLSETAHCDGSTEKVGLNSYYAQGQLYIYGNASCGLRKIKDGEIKQDHEVLGLTVIAAATGKLPHPTYVTGVAYLEIDPPVFRSFTVQGDFSLGENCSIIN